MRWGDERGQTKEMAMQTERSVLFFAETTTLQTQISGRDVSIKPAGVRENIANLDGLIKFCNGFKKFSLDKSTYKICLGMDVLVKTINDLSIQPPVMRMNGDRYSFIVSTSGKLLFVDDLPNIFDGLKLSEQPDPYTPCPIYLKTFDGHDAHWRILTDKDTVVDTNLNQIWPITTKKPPIKIIEMLNKTAENSR